MGSNELHLLRYIYLSTFFSEKKRYFYFVTVGDAPLITVF